MNNVNFYHPKFIPTWALIAVMWLGSKLPFSMQVLVGKGVGKLLYFILSRFKTIAFINISHCFPDKNPAAVKQLVKQNFESIGIAIFETANAYFAKTKKIQKLTTFEHQHHLTDALKKQQNIILLSGHFMPLMLSSRPLLIMCKIANIYRPQNNLLFDKVMRQSLLNNGADMIKAKDARALIKAIKSGTPIWYAPDQDMGEKHCVFAPFFNIQTATTTATARLAKIPNTVVIPYFFSRTDCGYTASFGPPLQHYPSNDAIQDARTTNQILQHQILKAPEQYLWIHQRFKTRPQGEKKFY